MPGISGVLSRLRPTALKIGDGKAFEPSTG